MNQQLALSGNQLSPELISQMVSILPLLPSELLDKEQSRRTALQVKQLADDLKNQSRVVTEYIAKNEDDKHNMLQMFSGISETSQQQTKIIQNTLSKVSFVTADPDVYKTLTEIGHLFIPNITAEQLGIMLIKFQFAQKKQVNINGYQQTVPYTTDSNSRMPIAKPIPHILPNGKEVINYKWNADMVQRGILKQLESIGRLYEFQLLTTPKEISLFVKSL